MESVAKQLVTNIDRKALVDLACDLIRIPSPRAEETAVARWLAQYFAERGYDVDLQEVEPGRFQAIAMLRGIGGGKKLMLNGHLDNDPLSYGWKRDPWTPSVEGDLLYGAGSWNMKCGVATMIAVAETGRGPIGVEKRKGAFFRLLGVVNPQPAARPGGHRRNAPWQSISG
ncbi:MAG TPA: hypothetical protein VGX21_05495 [Methylomirabilota bacterium]|nr:hypothetical protein [Methylomirabilota bacterium]